MQASLSAKTSTEGMRLLNEGSGSSEMKKAKMRSGSLRYLKGDYLILILGIGAYIMIKRKKSRRIDL